MEPCGALGESLNLPKPALYFENWASLPGLGRMETLSMCENIGEIGGILHSFIYLPNIYWALTTCLMLGGHGDEPRRTARAPPKGPCPWALIQAQTWSQTAGPESGFCSSMATGPQHSAPEAPFPPL